MKETIWHRLVHGGRRLRQRPHWAAFAGADWADRIMHTTVSDRFHAKQGRSIGRWVLQAGDRQLVVYLKRHYRLPWWRGLLALVWPNAAWSPALQEWRHLEMARAGGLPVPEAVAAGQFVGPGTRLQSFLAVAELTDMLPLHEAVPLAAARLDSVSFARWKLGLVAEMVRLTRALHRRCWFHKDLYLCHFYIAEEDTRHIPAWAGRVRIIDLHRFGHHPWTWPFWQTKDLGQLLYSSEVPGVMPRDRLRFWRLYLGESRNHISARLLRRWIRFRAWRYHRHQERKRRGNEGIVHSENHSGNTSSACQS